MSRIFNEEFKNETKVYLCKTEVSSVIYDNKFIPPTNVAVKIVNGHILQIKKIDFQNFNQFPILPEDTNFDSSSVSYLNGYEIIQISEKSVSSIFSFIKSDEFDYIIRNIHNKKCVNFGNRNNIFYFFCRMKRDRINI